MIKKKFKITGMHCSSCAMSIDMDLEDLEGIEKAQTSYAKEETEVEYDMNKVNEQKIADTIKQTGYVAVPVTQNV
ncbi:heavy-metal-associated domain-containing protein [Candidatus Gottesmanbacteria bacterium]|nr:heavy-metal-associated domain-containing protein [Candidatus Gottesmanbacteria bacterium]